MVLFQKSPHANTIGYMHELECKPITSVEDNKPKIWETIAFEKKVKYMYFLQ